MSNSLQNVARSAFAATYVRLGTLVCLSVFSGGLAAVLHHFSRLPSGYTWLEPLRTLKTVGQLPHFPVAIIVTYALGAYARRGDWDVEGTVSFLRAAQQRHARFARAAMVGGAVCAIDALVLGTRRDAADLVALIAMGCVLSGHRLAFTEVLRHVAYLFVASATFMTICYAFTVLKALTFASGRSYDGAIVAFEMGVFGTVPHRSLANWVAHQTEAVAVCDWVYFRFFHHMTLMTVLLAGLKRPRERTEYLGALALCYLLGGPLYHVVPAAGPGYFEPEYFRFLDGSPLMTSGIREWLGQNTAEILRGDAPVLRTWGYVACMPSLHIAQELVMLYYARASRVAFTISLLFTACTLFAVVALGWHYPTDSLVGGAVAWAAIWIAHWQRDVLMPRGLVVGTDCEILPPVPARQLFARLLRALRADPCAVP